MPEYRTSDGKPVEAKSTKYDDFTLVKTDNPYRLQKGSGRSICFELAKDGMKIGKWIKLCANKGFKTPFVIGSLIKLDGTEKPGWKFSKTNSKGQSIADVKKVREVDPAKAKERADKAAAAKAAKAQAKEDKKAAKAAKAKPKGKGK